MKVYKFFAAAAILALMLIALSAALKSFPSLRPPVFAPRTMLAGLWNNYKANYVEADTGRTVDRQQNGITTSEGQSYTMLRAVWMDDKQAFDRAWQWTKANLRREDGLHAWLYGPLPDGKNGILTGRGGSNSATDAEEDIALALVFASYRWQDPEYWEDALQTIRAIWDNETLEINGKRYLVANDVEKNFTGPVLINLSYFAPYAYRIFAEIDPTNDWQAVIDSGYQLMVESSQSPLNTGQSAGLPPDWLAIDRATGEILPDALSTGLTTNYSYDAMRIPWRLSLDWKWFKEQRARQALENFSFLSREWENLGRISATYSHDGLALDINEAPAMYGCSLGYFTVTKPQLAEEIAGQKLHALYSPESFAWKENMGYYDENWAWFGLALYHGLLINLFEPNN